MKSLCVKTVAGALKRCMPNVCRTSGCSGASIDELRHCPACGVRYRRERRRGRELASATRRVNWDLFVFLDEPHARRLAEHIVGNARIGRTAILYAVSDFIAEAHDSAAGESGGEQLTRRLRGRLRVLPGGAS